MVREGRHTRPAGPAVACVGSSGNREVPSRNSVTPPCAPARWVCAIYLGFSGFVGVQRKRGLRGAGGEISGPPGPWSIALALRKIARSPGGPHRLFQCARAVGLRHLLGFAGVCGSSAKTGRRRRGGCGRNTRPPDPRPTARGLQEIARFLGESHQLPQGPRAAGLCAIYSDFLGSVGIRR